MTWNISKINYNTYKLNNILKKLSKIQMKSLNIFKRIFWVIIWCITIVSVWYGFEQCNYPVSYNANECITAIDGHWDVQWSDDWCTMPAYYRVTGNIYMWGNTITLTQPFGINLNAYNIQTWWWRFNTPGWTSWKFQDWVWYKWWYCINQWYSYWWGTVCPEWTYVIHPCDQSRMVQNNEYTYVAYNWQMRCARARSSYVAGWWGENECWCQTPKDWNNCTGPCQWSTCWTSSSASSSSIQWCTLTCSAESLQTHSCSQGDNRTSWNNCMAIALASQDPMQINICWIGYSVSMNNCHTSKFNWWTCYNITTCQQSCNDIVTASRQAWWHLWGTAALWITMINLSNCVNSCTTQVAAGCCCN